MTELKLQIARANELGDRLCAALNQNAVLREEVEKLKRKLRGGGDDPEKCPHDSGTYAIYADDEYCRKCNADLSNTSVSDGANQ